MDLTLGNVIIQIKAGIPSFVLPTMFTLSAGGMAPMPWEPDKVR